MDKDFPKQQPPDDKPKADVTSRMWSNSTAAPSSGAATSKNQAMPGSVQACTKCGHKVSLRYGDFCPQCGTVSF